MLTRSSLYLLLALLAPAVLALVAGCSSKAVVETATVVHPGGSIERSVVLEARTHDGEVPDAESWPGRVLGIEVADEEAWSRVLVSEGRLELRGLFPAGTPVPPSLAHRLEGEAVEPERRRVRLEREDLVVLERFVYVETIGDPASGADVAAALDELVELVADALRHALRREFGDDVDLARFESWLAEDVRPLVHDAHRVWRESSGSPPGGEEAERAWEALLARHGLPPSALEGDETQLLRVLGERFADAVSTETEAVTLAELDFWPTHVLEDEESGFTRLLADRYGSQEAFEERAAPAWRTIRGTYGGASPATWRFRDRLRLPGTLLRTNGTPHEGSIFWIYREEDLRQGDVALRATSVEVTADALIDLNARRVLGPVALLELEELLVTDDPERVLAGLLRGAAEAGDLDVLLDAEQVPAEWSGPARELHGLLGRTE